ncbi:glycoside hydrolase family 6 protein [Micromonospora tarapacensis]|uniref:glycoside hydrolase family 6 protein n=1 Tax=Micromonospora tarapacensis TaxID=2835305 RepID=UPI002F41DE37
MLFSLPRWSVLALPTVALLLVSAGCGRPEARPAPDSTPEPGTATSAGPTRSGDAPVRLAGAKLFVDPTGAAAEQVTAWENAGRTDDADRIRRISEQPAAVWITDPTAQVQSAVDAVLTRAAGSGGMPVLVAYHIPGRDCGSFSGGGAPDGDDYRTWIRNFAAGIGSRPVTVIVEPDAVAHSLDDCADGDDRLALLADAVAVLKQTGTAQVYLDAGHPRWVRDVSRLSRALRAAGIEQADGFTLNVSNFIRTSENVDYGRRLSDALGGRTRFVVDTSRNGAGPVERATVDGGPAWCNPPGRRLGAAPTTSAGLDRVDALLWIKRPGESDGACRPGEPPAGRWWSDYALRLAGD